MLKASLSLLKRHQKDVRLGRNIKYSIPHPDLLYL
jgi:hypothetical protein